MRIFRIQTSQGELALATRSEGTFLRCLGHLEEGFRATDEVLSVESILPPAARSSTIFAIGLNYREHAIEMDKPIPDWPVITMKNPASLIGNPVMKEAL